MRAAEFNQFMRIFGINRLTFRLYIGTVISADIRPFVPVHVNLFEGGINDIGRPFDVAFLVGVFNAEQKITALRLGNQIFI